MGYIYRITNQVNKKQYVGQTIDLDSRWHHHRTKKNSNCRYLKYAFAKYGMDNFVFELICICFDDDMNAYEEQYIEMCKTLVPNGYNLRKGGNSGRHHEETKRKISMALKGNRNGVVNVGMLGKHHTAESKKLISEAMKKRHATEEGKKVIRELTVKYNRSVVQCDVHGNVIEEFVSLKQVAMKLGVSRAYVSMVCSGKRKTLKGLFFKYNDTSLPNTQFTSY